MIYPWIFVSLSSFEIDYSMVLLKSSAYVLRDVYMATETEQFLSRLHVKKSGETIFDRIIFQNGSYKCQM